MRLVTARLMAGALPYTTVTLDPVTQVARYADADGRLIEFGKHGTSRATNTASVSGGGDGNGPQPQIADDNTTDYTPD